MSPRFILLAALFISATSLAQKKSTTPNPAVYVDKEGVMRWKSNNTEASFFGVNYTTPFAYAYRAHKALGVDMEKAIQQDVYHLSRIGLDAFRVHVWDNEISDVSGNLIDNDHLKLFDFLLAELKKRNIKTIITPIAFWGNGYPERDERTPGFSRFYGRGKLTTNDSAIVAQEVYLKQFFKHVNPYTKMTYQDDPDVIAVELNNEPSHSGPKPAVTQYINRLAAAVKSTGWTKPVFYNISQGPWYADAVAASVVDGFSFQWYPSGLVGNQTLKGNALPNVDQYIVPFDTNKNFHKKALMVYEFDAADVLQPNMYPVMARSFRGAGFQWATQFAYDPMALAYANTEYQTHFLNLAYTPAKAISMLIASRVFHKVPRLKKYGTYPASSSFDVFRVSYKESLSEMNSEQEFYYSNSTKSTPVNAAKLQHVAGVGYSKLIDYDGTGAYFLDKIEDGVWRLELMPDAIFVRDPFERASPKKEVSRIMWTSGPMLIRLPDLGPEFSVKGVNEGNSFEAYSASDGFIASPGTYLLTKKGKKLSAGKGNIGPIGLNEFVAPKQGSNEMLVLHEPFTEVSAGKPFTISARVVGLDTGRIAVQINRVTGQFRNIPMVRKSGNEYTAEVPVEVVQPGILNYRIIMRKGKDVSVFPGNLKSDPGAWDNIVTGEPWKTYVANAKGDLEIFNPNNDRSVRVYPTFRRGFQFGFITGKKPNQLVYSVTGADLTGDKEMGFSVSIIDKLRGRVEEMASFDKLVVRARTSSAGPVKAKVALTFSDASTVSAIITITGDMKDIEIPLSSMKPDSAMLMPRPYPQFQQLNFTGPVGTVNLAEAERIEVSVGAGLSADELKKPSNVEVENIFFRKKE